MSETCRVLQQNKIGIISASGWLFKKKIFTILSFLLIYIYTHIEIKLRILSGFLVYCASNCK